MADFTQGKTYGTEKKLDLNPNAKTQSILNAVAQKNNLPSYESYFTGLPEEQAEIFRRHIADVTQKEGQAAGEKLGYRYAAGLEYAKLMDSSLEDTMNSMDSYNQTMWKNPVDEKGALKAIGDYFKLGKNVLASSELGNKLYDAELRGSTKEVEAILNEYRAVQAENETLQDGVPRNLFVEALKNAAQTVPYTAAVAIPSVIGGALGGQAGAFVFGGAAGYGITFGNDYIEFREAGFDKELAGKLASASSIAETVIEQAVGNIAEAGVTAAGKKIFSKKIVNRVLGKIGGKSAFMALVKKGAGKVGETVVSAGGEALEEGLQSLANQIAYEVGGALQEEGVEIPSWNDWAKGAAEEMKGAFMGSLILGPSQQLLASGVSKALKPEDYQDVMDKASTIESKTMFEEAVKDSKIFEGLSEEERKKAVDSIWESAEARREADIAESMDVSENAEGNPVDETGERVGKASEFRTEEGELATEKATGPDGKNYFLVGDTSRTHSLEADGNRYGYIEYSEDDKTVTINQFKMTSGRENIAKEFYQNFAENFAGKKIVWNPKQETNLNLKNEIINENPRGKKAGLDYFENAEVVSTRKADLKIARQIKAAIPSMTTEQVGASLSLVKAVAKAQGMTTDQLLQTFDKEQIVTNEKTAGVIQGEQQLEGQFILGAHELNKAGKAIIYVAKNGDMNTFVHEFAHHTETFLTPEQRNTVMQELGFDSWSRETSEQFADGLIKYMRTGKAQTKGLQAIFEKVAQIIGNAIRGFQDTVQLSKKLMETYEELMKDDGSGLSQAMKIAEEVDEKLSKSQKKDAETKADTKISEEENQEVASQATDEARDEKGLEETKEDIVKNAETVKEAAEALNEKAEEVIQDVNSSTEEKAQAAADASGADYVDNLTGYDLFQTIGIETILNNILDSKRLSFEKLLQDVNNSRESYRKSGYSEDQIKKMIEKKYHIFEDYAGKMKLDLDVSNWRIINSDYLNAIKDGKEKIFMLDEILHAPNLYNLIPKIKDTEVHLAQQDTALSAGIGPNNGDNIIYINLNKIKRFDGADSLISVLSQKIEQILQAEEREHTAAASELEIELYFNAGKKNKVENLKKKLLEDPAYQAELEAKNKFGEGSLFQIIGEKGALELDRVNEVHTLEDNRNIAKEMEEAGKDAKTIRLATGWEKGIDGKWRYETEDLVNKFDLLNKALDFEKRNPKFKEYSEKLWKSYDGGPELTEAEIQEFDALSDEANTYYVKKDVKLKDILDAPELYAAYPQLKEIDVKFVNDPLNTTKASYVTGKDLWTDAEVNLIQINNIPNSINEKEYESILLHELQHAIQRIEGFAVGGNPNMFEATGGKPSKFQETLMLLDDIPMEELKNYKDHEEFKTLQEYLPEVLENNFDGLGTLTDIMDRWLRDVDNGVRSLESIYDEIQYARKAYNKYNKLGEFANEKSPFEKYQSLAGEVEARNVQKRMELSAEERLNTLLSDSEDIERDQQIILYQTLAAEAAVEAAAQERAVREEYENTENWMKAPNGEDTNLTEKQWVQVRTDNFKKWFGDWENDPQNASKVVDENGEPLVVYHGTTENFTVFDASKSRANMDIQGNFFSPWDIDAQGYGPNVRAFYLNIKNPADESKGYKALHAFTGQNGAGTKARELLKAQGYDGVNNGNEEYIAFDPNQIKSATDNNGNFDESNPDILFQAVERIDSVLNSEPVINIDSSSIKYDVKNLKQSGIEYIKNNPQESVETEIGRIVIDEKGIENSLSHTLYLNKILSIPAIRPTLEKGVYLGVLKDFDGELQNNYYFAAPIKIDENDKILFIRVKHVAGRDKLFYIHDIFTSEEIEKAAPFSGEPDTTRRRLRGAALAKSIIQDYEKNNVVQSDSLKNLKESGSPLYQLAYHGTSADFEKFDTDTYALSGEGSMSFGYGTYVTSDRDIALDYAERQGNPFAYRIKALTEIIKEEEELLKENLSERVRYVKEKDLKIYKAELEKLKEQQPSEDEIRGKRKVYTVEIPDDGFIKWDENAKPELIEQIVKEYPYMYGLQNLLNNYNKWKDNPNATYLYGSNIYRAISKELGSDKAATHFLYNLGFKGVDYPAGSIHGNGNGARNYVVFSDDDLNIVDKTLFQTAYHGTSADFEKFDLNYGLSGEGSMSFGYGVYLTNDKAIAEDYAQRQAERKSLKNLAEAMLEHIESGLRTFEEEKQFAIERYSKYIKTGNSIRIAHDMPRLEFAQSLTTLDDLKKAVDLTGKRHLYTTTIPDGKYLYWDKDIGMEEAKKIAKGFRKYCNEHGVEIREEIFEEDPSEWTYNSDEITGETLYSVLKVAINNPNSIKVVSEYLNSIGYVGVDYPAGSIHGNGNGARNYVIFDENDVIITDNTLYQTEKEMFDHAATFDSWEDYKADVEGYREVFGNDSNVNHVPVMATDQWYKDTWEQAKAIAKRNTYDDDFVQDVRGEETEETESLKDQQWYDEISNNENMLLEFVRALSYNAFAEHKEAPADYEEQQQWENEKRLRDRFFKEIGGALSKAALVARRYGPGEKIELDDKTIKAIKTMLKNNKRDFRDLYADFTGDSEWAIPEGMTTNDKIAVRIGVPVEETYAYTPKEKQAIIDRLDFEDLKKEIKDGSLEMDDDRLFKLMNGYEADIRKLEKKIEALKKQEEEDAVLNIKQTAEIERLYQEKLEKQARQEQLKNIRDIKVRLVKDINRKVDFKTINYDEGRKIIAIQALWEDRLSKYVNDFINQEGAYIRDAYSLYKTDFNYRARLQALSARDADLGGKGSRNLSKVIKLFETKTFDKWTEEERQFVAEHLPLTDWIKELGLEQLSKERKGALQMELQSEEVQNLLKEALPEEMLSLLSQKEIKNWTLEQMEDLVAIVNNIRKEGREKLQVKNEARLQAAEAIRNRIEAALKDSGIAINADDDDKTKERKQKKIDAFNKKVLGIGNPIKGTLEASKSRQNFLNRLLHGYSDANVRRVARILDNGKEGANTTLLYYRENECYNQEQKMMRQRSQRIERAVKENDIKLSELFEKVTVNFADGSAEFTVDELLYFAAASLDDNSREAVACGNMYDDTVKSQYRGSEELQEQYQNMAYARYDKVLEAAEALPEKFKKLSEAIQKDYGEQYERMNKISIDEFNSPVWRVQHYVPLIRLESNGDTNANRVKQDLLGSMGGTGSNWVDKGMTKKRVEISPANQKPVETGLYSTWADSLKRTEHFIAYASYVRELNRVYMNRDSGKIKQLMQNRYGDGISSYINNYINEVANPDAGAAKTDFDRIIHALRGKTAPAYLSWKMSGIIKQACTSPWPFMAHVSPAEYAGAAFDLARNYKETCDAIKNKSEFMNARRFDPIADLLDEQKAKARNKFAAGLNNFETLGMQGLEWIDWACVAPGWLAVYRKEYARLSSDKEQNALVEERRKQLQKFEDVEGLDWIEEQAQRARLSEDEIERRAVLKADDITRLCQPSNRLTDLAPMFKQRGPGSEVARTILQFTTSLNVIWQNIRYDLPEYARAREFEKVIGTIAGYTLAGIAMGLVTEGLGGDDDDDDENTELRKLLWFSTTQFTDAVPLVGSVMSNYSKWAITGEKPYNFGMSDLFPLLTKTGSGIQKASQDKWDKAIDDWAYAAGLGIGLPVSGIKELKAAAGIGDDDGELEFKPEAFIGRR